MSAANRAIFEAAAREMVLAQSRMLDRWSEGDSAVRTALWQELHRCGEELRTALDRERKERWREIEIEELRLRDMRTGMMQPPPHPNEERWRDRETSARGVSEELVGILMDLVGLIGSSASSTVDHGQLQKDMSMLRARIFAARERR